jgi:hypothetical protein
MKAIISERIYEDDLQGFSPKTSVNIAWNSRSESRPRESSAWIRVWCHDDSDAMKVRVYLLYVLRSDRQPARPSGQSCAAEPPETRRMSLVRSRRRRGG